MHTGTLRKLLLALTFWVALHFSPLRAQTFTAPLQASTTGTNPVDFEFRADGTLIAKGNLGVGNLLSTDQGVGTRMLWYPALGAFRAGTITQGNSGSDYINNWDQSNIGQNSVAMGVNTTASGADSVALGRLNFATGQNSVALGIGAIASGYRSTSFGMNSVASGTGALVFGSDTSATGYSSTAFGYSTVASGSQATAWGNVSSASGTSSTAFGNDTIASGNYSTASGNYTTAQSLNSFVVGAYNIGGGDPSNWVGTDPLFEIGNGMQTASAYYFFGYPDGYTYSVTHSDALVVYKNGNAILQGTLQVAPGGDIPMYTGN